MEEKMLAIVEGHPNIKDIKVLDCKDMKNLGMNMFFSIGEVSRSAAKCVIIHYEGNKAEP